MSGNPLVSFVVPCYNTAPFLSDCLGSIFSQQGGFDFEVIATDDCSTDETWEVLNSFTDRRLRKFRHTTNQGHVITITEGLAAARGEFVARIDSDDRYHPRFLATLLPHFERSPRVGLVHGDVALINDKGEFTCPRCDDGVHKGRAFQGSALLAILQRNYLCAPSAIARREAWQKHLPIWEGMAFSDWYFNVMIAREYDFVYIPEVVADYRVHQGNLHSRIVLNRSEEPSLMRLLDWVFTHPEADPGLEQQKQRAKSSVYAAHYLDQAEKYFGVGYNADARRCYLRAFGHRPSLLLAGGPARRFTATVFGRAAYERLKAILGRRLSPERAR